MKKSKLGKSSNLDIISNLPNPILHSILSRLPTTEEVVRTSILSTRWRYLWTSVPSIDVDCTRGSKTLTESNKNKFEAFVSRVLANNSLELDSFRLCYRNHYDISIVGQWIDVAVRRKVKLLDLVFSGEDAFEIELPHCLVNCDSLEALRLSLCAFRVILPKSTRLPVLRVLELKNCSLFNDDLVKNFLKSCPLLEDLSLVDCVTFDINLLCIECPNLKNLRFDNRNIRNTVYMLEAIGGMCRQLHICCPNLVFLEFSGFMAHSFIFESLDFLKKVVIRNLDTFKWTNESLCELFAGYSHVESLSLCIFSINKSINFEDLPKSLPNLKTLELTTTDDAFNIDVLIRILICSPNLESLTLIIQQGLLGESFSIEVYDLEFFDLKYECIFEGLKIVKMEGMSSVLHHMRFIKFLLKNSPVLETMSIAPSVNMTIDGILSFFANVPKFQRASTQAEIVFLQDQA